MVTLFLTSCKNYNILKMGCAKNIFMIIFLLAYLTGVFGILVQGIIIWKSVKPWLGYSNKKDETFLLATWICCLVGFVVSVINSVLLCICGEKNICNMILSFVTGFSFSAALTLTSIVFGDSYSKEKCQNLWDDVINNADLLMNKWTEERAKKFYSYLENKGYDSIINGCQGMTLRIFIFSLIAKVSKDIISEVFGDDIESIRGGDDFSP